ncbi:class I SAM-dependent methyltransferase [Aestuariispira ectoiniformans]|uniref:class I SAM-dependent methyltransferase n=1 Tax=Aestuariispira ectoiniformans TaxID=2775080 RepID=UPI00223A991C|nr:class I SAM-dependent methyltransferase [Aestuariispira ectoiniformans]
MTNVEMVNTDRQIKPTGMTGMAGGGFYNANSAPQWAQIAAVLPWLEDAITELPFAEGTSAITFADFGCSEGRNSISVMHKLLARAMDHTDRPFLTLHSDLPTNDYSKLFLGLRPDGKSAFDGERVSSAAVGGSMYDRLLPPQSVHVATTFNSIGYLSERPLDLLPGYILPNGPSKIRGNGYITDSESETFARHAEADMAAFLTARSKELVPGGKLMVQVFGCVDDIRTCDGLFDLLNDAVRAHVDRGDIPSQVYEKYYQPVYFRTLDELIAPLKNPVYELSHLYSLDRTEAYEVPVPFVEAYKQDGDLDRYAASFVNFFRAFTQAALTSSLPDTPSKTDLVNQIYQTADTLLKANPEVYPFRNMSVAMLLTRK